MQCISEGYQMCCYGPLPLHYHCCYDATFIVNAVSVTYLLPSNSFCCLSRLCIFCGWSPCECWLSCYYRCPCSCCHHWGQSCCMQVCWGGLSIYRFLRSRCICFSVNSVVLAVMELVAFLSFAGAHPLLASLPLLAWSLLLTSNLFCWPLSHGWLPYC